MNLESLNLNIFNIIIISGVIHGLIFSIIVLNQKKKFLKYNRFLALTILFLSLSNLQYWIIDTSLTSAYPILKHVFIPWQWLIMPMFYSYVYQFTTLKKLKTQSKLLLLFPFFIVFGILMFLNLYFNSTSSKISIHLASFLVLDFFAIVFNAIILLLSLREIKTYEKTITKEVTNIFSKTLWLKQLIIIGFVICIIWLLTIIVSFFIKTNQNHLFYPMWILISGLIYWIGYVGLEKSKLLIERNALKKQSLNITLKHESKNDTSETFSKIENKIKTEQLFLNPNLNLKALSKRLDLSEGYISQQINANSNFNFNDYINNLRVEKAKQFLKDTSFDNYTIAAIGLESGFNSKSSFYTAFKKFTNKTPVQFQKDVRNL